MHTPRQTPHTNALSTWTQANHHIIPSHYGHSQRDGAKTIYTRGMHTHKCTRASMRALNRYIYSYKAAPQQSF